MRHRNHFCGGVLIVLSVMLSTSLTLAQAPSKTDCEGRLYRAKRDDVPVFDEPQTTGAIVSRLHVGERVCWVGERDGFAIIVVMGSERLIRYVKIHDLWPPRSNDDKRGNAPQSLFDSAKGQMQRILRGIPTEDPLAPYRQVLTPSPVQQPSAPPSDPVPGRPSP